MPEQNCRVGQNVERVVISDEPHDRYRVHDPITGKKLNRGIPILKSVTGGKVIRKKVTYYTIKCPNCLIPAVFDNDSEPVCPECGIICSGRDTLREEQIVRDAKAAGRIDGGSGKASA